MSRSPSTSGSTRSRSRPRRRRWRLSSRSEGKEDLRSGLATGPDEAALDEDAKTSHAALVPGATVRLVAPSDLGLIGTVSQEPRRERFGDGQMVDVVAVNLSHGGTRVVPVADVEVVA